MLQGSREGKAGACLSTAKVILNSTEALRETIQGMQLLNLEAGRIAMQILFIILFCL
jgi:hypothetical protein